MKIIKPLFFALLLLTSCDSKKEGIIDGQKLINKQLTGLYETLNRISDSAEFYRLKHKIDSLHFKYDSLSTELKKFD